MSHKCTTIHLIRLQMNSFFHRNAEGDTLYNLRHKRSSCLPSILLICASLLLGTFSANIPQVASYVYLMWYVFVYEHWGLQVWCVAIDRDTHDNIWRVCVYVCSGHLQYQFGQYTKNVMGAWRVCLLGKIPFGNQIWQLNYITN